MKIFKTFLRIIIFTSLIVMPLSCSKGGDDSAPIDNNGGDVVIPPVEVNPDLAQINVSIKLPDGASIKPDDLTLSSIFTDNKSIIEGSGMIETFKNSPNELIFALNGSDNILLLGYVDSNTTYNFTLNVESTAIALVMMHPWTFDLSEKAKSEAITFIKGLPEFTNFKEALNTSIISGELNPLGSNQILNELIKVQSVVFKRDLEKYKMPLNFNINGSVATVTNKTSSAAYSIGLYDEDDNLYGHDLAVGVEKFWHIFSDFQNFIYGQNANAKATIDLDIPNAAGKYILKAKSGLSYDGSLENQQAAFHNTSLLIGNILGLFSKQLKDFLSDPTACVTNSAEWWFNFVFTSLTYRQNLEKFRNGTITGYEFTLSVVKVILSGALEFTEMLERCFKDALNGGKILNKYIKGTLDFFDIVGKSVTGFNTIALLDDWNRFDAEIEICFVKTGNDAIFCGLEFKGDLNFGNVFVGQSVTKIIDITNIDESPIEISEFSTPDRVYIDVINKVINVGETIQVDVKFEPSETKEYSGDVKAVGFADETLGFIKMTGKGIAAFTLSGDLNFGDVPINTSPTKELTITNNLTEQLNIIEAGVIFPTGFNGNIPSTIEAEQSVIVDIRFNPSLIQEYSGDIIIDTSNGGLMTIVASGTGVQGNGLRIENDLNFGEIEVGSSGGSKSINIYNDGII
ncbi:MAG: choice-of-anchor D domain-containing protein, partial [Flaviramulus sp.]